MSIPANADTSSSQGAACDRCRGQKLRCVWEPGSRPCKRCTRAKADCVVSPPKQTGRPPRKGRTELSQRGGMTVVPNGDEGAVMGDRNGAVYDLGIPPSDGWPISEDVDKLTAERRLGQLAADGSPSNYLVLDGFREPEEAGEAYHGLDISNSFIASSWPPYEHSVPMPELMLDTDSCATSAAPGGIDLSPTTNPCQITAESRKPRSVEEVLECIAQLCELNVGLCQYHAPVTTATKLRVGDVNQPTPPPHLTPYNCLNDEMGHMEDDFDLSTLQIGQLLSLASQLSTINARLGTTQGSGTRVRSRGGTPGSMASSEICSSALEQAAHHLIIGCYYRLEYIFSHVLKILDRARTGHSLRRASTLLQTGTPSLVIDGFALDGNRDMQLDLAMHACERMLRTTRRGVLPCEP